MMKNHVRITFATWHEEVNGKSILWLTLSYFCCNHNSFPALFVGCTCQSGSDGGEKSLWPSLPFIPALQTQICPTPAIAGEPESTINCGEGGGRWFNNRLSLGTAFLYTQERRSGPGFFSFFKLWLGWHRYVIMRYLSWVSKEPRLEFFSLTASALQTSSVPNRPSQPHLLMLNAQYGQVLATYRSPWGIMRRRIRYEYGNATFAARVFWNWLIITYSCLYQIPIN